MPFVLVNRDTGFRHELECPGRTSIGRGPSNDIQPDSKSVSKTHAEIELFLEGWKKPLVRDFNSRNGTFVGRGLDWKKVNGDEQLEAGDIIRFGNAAPTSFLFQWEEEPLKIESAPMPEDNMGVIGEESGALDDQNGNENYEDDDYEATAGHESTDHHKNMTVELEFPTANSPGERLQPVNIRVDPGSPSPKSSSRRSGRSRRRDMDRDRDRDRDRDGSRRGGGSSRSRSRGNSRDEGSRSRERDYDSGSDEESDRYKENRGNTRGSKGSLRSRQDKPETLQLRSSRNSSETRTTNTGLHTRSGDPSAQTRENQPGAFASSMLGPPKDTDFSDPFDQPGSPLRPNSRGHSQSYGKTTWQEKGNPNSNSNSFAGLGGVQRSLAEAAAMSPVPSLRAHHRSPAGGRYGGPPLHPGTGLALGLSNMPANQPHHSDALLDEALGGLGGAKLMELDDWQPRSQLTLPERREVERHREELAESVRQANKALSGAMNFSDWRRTAEEARRAQAEEARKVVTGGSGGGGRSAPWKYAESAAAEELKPPPEHGGRSPDVLALVEDMLGTTMDQGREADFFFRVEDIRVPALSEAVVLEVLAESLQTPDVTVVGRLDSLVEHMQKAYMRSYHFCLVDDYDFEDASKPLGEGAAPPVAVVRCAEVLSLACDTLSELVKSGLVVSVDDAEDERRRPGESETEHKIRLRAQAETAPTRMGDRLRFAVGLCRRAYERVAGQPFGEPMHPLLRMEALAKGLDEKGGDVVVSDASALLPLPPSKKHAVIANTLYAILVGLRPLLTQMEMLMNEVEQAAGKDGDINAAAMLLPSESGNALLRSLNPQMEDGELRLSRSVVGLASTRGVEEGAGEPLTARIVKTLESKRIRGEQANLSRGIKGTLIQGPPKGGWDVLMDHIEKAREAEGIEGATGANGTRGKRVAEIRSAFSRAKCERITEKFVRACALISDHELQQQALAFRQLKRQAVLNRTRTKLKAIEEEMERMGPGPSAALAGLDGRGAEGGAGQEVDADGVPIMGSRPYGPDGATAKHQINERAREAARRRVFDEFGIAAGEEDKFSDPQDTVGRPYHLRIVRELKSKCRDLEERIHEIALLSDTDAALIAEKALNRELQAANILLRDNVDTLRGQLLDMTNAPAEHRRDMLRTMLAQDEEFKQANREIRALREQLTRLHGMSPQDQVAVLKRGGAEAKPSMSKWGTIPPLMSELKKPKGAPGAPTPHPTAVGGVEANGKPRLRTRRPWTKAQCKLISRDDARMIVLNEVRRLRHGFVEAKRSEKRLKDQLAEESSRNTSLTVALHALQERFMDKEKRLASLQAQQEQ